MPLLPPHARIYPVPTQADGLLRFVRSIASHVSPESDDTTLLARFLTAHDCAAFAALVDRHGPMVLRVCQHVLGNRHYWPRA
jgi:hypothetical protein